MRTDEEINAAIHACVADWEPGRSAILHVAEYLDRLRNDPAWSKEELRKVEVGVWRVIKGLI